MGELTQDVLPEPPADEILGNYNAYVRHFFQANELASLNDKMHSVLDTFRRDDSPKNQKSGVCGVLVNEDFESGKEVSSKMFQAIVHALGTVRCGRYSDTGID